MAFSQGKKSISIEDILSITTEADIASYYLGVSKIPCVICSPLRQDKHPSFGIYSPNGTEVNYIDFSTNEGGRIFTLLAIMWNIPIEDVYLRIYNEFHHSCTPSNVQVTASKTTIKKIGSNNRLQCKVREWKNHDIAYWNSYGISIEWLKYAEVYPISHKIVTTDTQQYIFGADKYAYAYVEHKEGTVTLKIYQPFNKKGYKWANKHDKSVISLWTKVPKHGEKICICSSLKDALCLWANTGIPALAIQGEGYPISHTAINDLKSRYTNVYILLDNDKAGIKDGKALAKATGFTNLILPKFSEGKDISDLYKSKGKRMFLETILPLFNN
jgi:hypothetical protein